MLGELLNAHSACSSHGAHMLLKQCALVRETHREVKDWTDCELTGEWYNKYLCMCVCADLTIYFCLDCSICADKHYLCLSASAFCCLPSLPVRVCPVGSSQPARLVALRAGSPGPRGVLFPAPASRSLLGSPPAKCIDAH